MPEHPALIVLMLTWEPKHWWRATADKSRGAVLLTLWFVLPGPVRFYEHGLGFVNLLSLDDTFIKWEDCEGYYWEDQTVCLVEKRAGRRRTRYRQIRIPRAKRKQVSAVLAAYLA